ncbi:MAG: flavin reductase family protein [Acidimicrobiales bacterium]
MGPSDAFSRLTGDLDYAMLVVTASDGRERAGCLVGFSTQCSFDPHRYLVCISRANHTAGVAAGAGVVAVHALPAERADLARLFGEETGDRTDKFARVAWRPGPGGAPVLDGCPSWFAGRVVDRLDLGDHTGLLLEPVEAAHAPGLRPLLFSAVRDLVPGHRP